ncbi:MAG: hypothetical protein Q8R29_00415 [bacterium]|nr:hypothetical protein [bacterium]
MPYVRKADKEFLDPFIACLKHVAATAIIKNIEKSKNDTRLFSHKCISVCFGYIAEKVLIEVALNSAKQSGDEHKLRYKLLAKVSGTVINILSELHDRVLKLSPTPYNFEVSLSQGLSWSDSDRKEFEISLELNLCIENLVNAITYMMGKGYYGDRDAFMGICNYSFTVLMPATLISVYKKFQKPFDWNAVLFLAQFWWVFYKEFYSKVARPYEDEQIKKNGDVEIYERMLKLLETKASG